MIYYYNENSSIVIRDSIRKDLLSWINNYMIKRTELEYIKLMHRQMPQWIVFTLCYINNDVSAMLHVLDNEFNDNGKIGLFEYWGLNNAYINKKTLYKMMLSKTLEIPECFKSDKIVVIINKDYIE